MTRPVPIRIAPGGTIEGELTVPGDKSISHRAVMLGSIAQGSTTVSGCLMGEDVRSTIGAFRQMGVVIDERADAILSINGQGIAALTSPSGELDLGNSGTSIRLLSGLLAGAGVTATMTGDESLRGRPMRRVTEPLQLMGASIDTATNGTPPISLTGGSKLRGINYELPMASAQVKSSILLAGLNATGQTVVTEPAATRDHTERMFRAFGIDLSVDGLQIALAGGQTLRATHIDVPGDISSAAFFLVGAAIAKDAELLVRNVGVNPTRTGIVDILRLMGADISINNIRGVDTEPVADIVVRSSPLRGIEIPPDLIPSAIDEFPAIFIAAAAAEGTTRLSQADELRHKESDRIDAMASGLQTLGIPVETQADGLTITGRPEGFDGGYVASRGDHRIAMAFSIAALRASAAVEIDDGNAVATSFPGFSELANRCGLKINGA